MRLPETLVRFRRHAAQKSVDAICANEEIRAILAEHLADRPEIGGTWNAFMISCAGQ